MTCTKHIKEILFLYHVVCPALGVLNYEDLPQYWHKLLLSDPLILYCDEPTTGLDSSSAITVFELLQQKAEEGKLILASIHQPSSQLYNYFDKIILLASGKLIFQGNKEQARDFFEGINLKCPKCYNPADFYVQNITVITNNSISNCQLVQWNKSYEEERHLSNSYLNHNLRSDLQVKFRKRNLIVQLSWLIWRNYIDTIRNIGYHVTHFGLLMFTAFVICVLYSDIKINDENSVQNFKGILFFVTSELIFTHLYAVIYIFPEEYNIFLREESVYTSYAYFLSKVIACIPQCILQPFLFLSIIFVKIHFPEGFLSLLQMTAVLFVGCLSAVTFGLSVSAVFQSLECIELFIMPLDLLSMLLAGILIKITTVPIFIRWLRYLSPFFYVYESLSILQWTNIAHLECSNKTSLPCYQNGKEVLEELGFNTDYSQILLNILGMFLLSLCFCFMGYLGIINKKRNSLR